MHRYSRYMNKGGLLDPAAEHNTSQNKPIDTTSPHKSKGRAVNKATPLVEIVDARTN